VSATPNCGKYLGALVSGSLDLLKRKKSSAKNIFWEVELWARMKKRGFDAELRDPPDILLDFRGVTIGIACKKLYSEKHVQNVLSQAVSQIEDNCDFGIAAINLDDLQPEDMILSQPSHECALEFLAQKNQEFMLRHRHVFGKYLSSGRLLSVLVSTTIVADMYKDKPKFNEAHHSTFWTIPGLPADKERPLNLFYHQLIA
jgi:hypothetical protein